MSGTHALDMPHWEAWTGVGSSASVPERTREPIETIRVRVRLANGSPNVAPFLGPTPRFSGTFIGY